MEPDAAWNYPGCFVGNVYAADSKIVDRETTDCLYCSHGWTIRRGDGIDGVGAEQMYLDINTPLAQWVDSIQSFKPNIIIGYPSAIKILEY